MTQPLHEVSGGNAACSAGESRGARFVVVESQGASQAVLGLSKHADYPRPETLITINNHNIVIGICQGFSV